MLVVLNIMTSFIFILFIGFVTPDDKTQCFNVGEKVLCYFRPNVSLVDWDTAWKTCIHLKATLPVIPDKDVQAVLVKFLNDHYSILPVWTAGRFTGGKEWKWLNGQTFRGKDEPSCPSNAQSCPHETQAVLSKRLRYEAGYPDHHFAYICNITGANCTSESIFWGIGCLNWKENDRQRLNDARNKCVERGGDLATFSGQDDLQRLQEVLPSGMFSDPDTSYWIGLHQKWWIWNATVTREVQDIKYNLMKTFHVNDCLFITVRSHEWMTDSCDKQKNVICETVTTTTRRPGTDGLDASTRVWFVQRNSTSSQDPFPAKDLHTTIITGAIVAVVVVTIAVVLTVALKRTKDKRLPNSTHDKSTIPHEMPTYSIENKSASSRGIKVEEMSSNYAEITRVSHENNVQCRDETQTGIVYATLEFDANKAIYAEPVKCSPRTQEASAPKKVSSSQRRSSAAESPTQAAEGAIYSNM